jgi:hypothetical protein
MANYVSTSLLITVQMLDAAGSSVYAGANAGLFVWGAQVELGTDYQTMLDDASNYKYVRSRGTTSNSYYARIGRDYYPDEVLGPEADRNYKSTQLLAHKAGVAQDLYINTNNSTKSNAPQSAEEVFVNYRADSAMAKRWYQLAPYYASYAHVIDYPTDPTDHVRIGSKQAGARTSNNAFENISFFQIPATLRDTATMVDTAPGKFYDKGFHETKTIPRIPKFDAAQVTGIFDHYKSARNINSSNYITLSGSYTYYRAYNWFSLTPNTRWSRFAFGSGDRLGPVMQETFEFGDTLSFTQTYKLPPDFFFPQERISTGPNIAVKRSRYDDLYAKTGNYTSSNSAQVAEIFDNYKTASVLGKRWYELSPYYASYNHTYISAQSPDQISLTAREFNNRNIIQDYYDINSGAVEDYQSDSGTEDFQVIAT